MKTIRFEHRVTADDTLRWQDNRLYLLDQRVLPADERFVECTDVQATAEAITAMVVRGAPAIGIAAAYGIVLAARERYAQSPTGWRTGIEQDLATLAASRPTAVNLFWAIARFREAIADLPDGDPEAKLLELAQAIHDADRADNRRMGAFGASLIEGPTAVITHCNTGGLATGGWGTALGVIRSAFAEGVGERLVPIELPRRTYVIVDPGVSIPTRALFQAAELTRDGAATTIEGFISGAATQNAFEPVVRARYPAVARALDWLGESGRACLSGTGGAVFVAVEGDTAVEIAGRCPPGMRAWVANGINVSPLLASLVDQQR